MAYAENTSVPVERTRAEIETVLRKYGADQFFSGWDQDRAFISFRARDRFVRFTLPLPKRDEKHFTHQKPPRDYWKRSEAEAMKLWEQAGRSRWRALLLTIKAKLESTEAGIETFEQAFLAHIVLPDQTLVGDRILGIIADAYTSGKMPALPAATAIDAEEIE